MALNFKNTLLLSCAAITVSAAQSQASSNSGEPHIEKVVVTGSRIGERKIDRLGTAATIIDGDQIAKRQSRFVSDILRDVPGLSVNRTGGPGGSSQVRMRGAEGNHTLVLFDGAEVSDPFQGEFDFAGLRSTDIERIEILRGSQSALYGSDAIGGVINIIPRRGNGPWSTEAQVEAGSFDTWLASANAGAGNGKFDLFTSVSASGSSGTNNSRFGSERDGYRDRAFFMNAGVLPWPNVEIRAQLRYVETYAEGDPQDFDFFSPTQGFAVDGNETSETRQLHGSLKAEISAHEGAWRTQFVYAFIDAARDNFAATLPSFLNEGERDKFSIVSAYSFDLAEIENTVTAAADFKRETYQNLPIGAPASFNDKRTLESQGYVLDYTLSAGDFDAGAALRWDDNEKFEDAATYRVQASYRFGETRLRASAGSGIKNPTNFELFGFDPTSFIGNPALMPESSHGWDVGLDQTFWNRNAKLSLTYFNATLDDEIFTDFLPGFISTPRNRTTQSNRSGIEAAADIKWNRWTLNASYTFLNADENGQQEVRRPEHSGSFNLSYDDGNKFTSTLTIRYNGRQIDNEFIFATPADFVGLPAFTLVNLAAEYRLSDHLRLTGRIENTFDENYEEVFSFQAPGRSVIVGLSSKF